MESSLCDAFDGESVETEHTKTIGQWWPIKSMNNAFEDGGELQKMSKEVGDGLEGLVEGATHAKRQGEAESSRYDIVRSSMSSGVTCDGSGNIGV